MFECWFHDDVVRPSAYLSRGGGQNMDIEYIQ